MLFVRLTITLLLYAACDVTASAQTDLERLVQEQAAAIQRLQATVNGLQNSVSQMSQCQCSDTQTKRVMFHAALFGNAIELSMNDRVIPGWVRENLGNAYNATSGEFTAPYNGHYFFTASTGGYGYETGAEADLILVVDGSERSYVRNTVASRSHQQGMCSYAGHLNAGQRVWLKTNKRVRIEGYLTRFTGFLVYPD